MTTSDFKLTSTRESSVEDEVIAFALNNGWIHRFMSYRGRRGCPDSFFFGYGRIVMMEFKKPGKGLDPLQIKEHARFDDVGVPVWVISRPETGIEVLRSAMGWGR
jgi:hypothetical protein